MSLQFIIGSSGAGKSYFAYERVIRESMEHPERNYYIIVPRSSLPCRHRRRWWKCTREKES